MEGAQAMFENDSEKMRKSYKQVDAYGGSVMSGRAESD
jgi:hypothetical protein